MAAYDNRNETTVAAGFGILQLAQRIAGLSGGSWCVGSWALSGFPRWQGKLSNIEDKFRIFITCLCQLYEMRFGTLRKASSSHSNRALPSTPTRPKVSPSNQPLDTLSVSLTSMVEPCPITSRKRVSPHRYGENLLADILVVSLAGTTQVILPALDRLLFGAASSSSLHILIRLLLSSLSMPSDLPPERSTPRFTAHRYVIRQETPTGV